MGCKKNIASNITPYLPHFFEKNLVYEDGYLISDRICLTNVGWPECPRAMIDAPSPRHNL